jgi:hypothetical protein
MLDLNPHPAATVAEFHRRGAAGVRRNLSRRPAVSAAPAPAGQARVPFPAGLDAKTFTAAKLAWLDDCAADPNISSLSFRVLYVMASKYLDPESGTAWVGHQRFVHEVGGSRRGVQKALDTVVAAGRLSRIVGGGCLRGGKGATNSYRPLVTANKIPSSDAEGRTWKHGKSELGDMGTVNFVRTTSLEESLEESQKKERPKAVAPETGSQGVATATTPSSNGDQECELFRRGKEILGEKSGGLIKNLLKAKGRIELARAAIEVAATKQDPREYVAAIIRGVDEREQHRGWDGRS